MFPMSPVMSWILIIAIAAIIALAMVIAFQAGERHAENALAMVEDAEGVHAAIVTQLPTRKNRRHLALVPELREVEESKKLARIRELPRTSQPSQPIYDWRTQGI